MSALPGLLAVLEAGRREGVAPAIAAAVWRGGEPLHLSCHGVLPAAGTDPGEPAATRPLDPDDLFDVASLTKPLVVASLAAQALEAGALALDAPAARWLPALAPGARGEITVRHLLAHASGLPAVGPWHALARADPVAGAAFLPPDRRPPPAALAPAFARGRALVAAAVGAAPLEAPPGSRAVYSDAGFILLGLLLEASLGASLGALAGPRVLAPLAGGGALLGGALARPAAAGAPGFVPGGYSEVRSEWLRGLVHDDNAWAMGGAAGHAGLFATAAGVAALGQGWLEALAGRRSPIPAGAAAALAARDPTPGSTRTAGWDTPSAAGSTLGDRLGRGRRGAIGHLGFTGCSLWIDLDAELVVALLANHTARATPDRPALNALRRRAHDAVAAGLGIG